MMNFKKRMYDMFIKTEKNSVLLPCGHCYHYDCIFKWFEKEMSCPTCKQDFVGKIYCKMLI